MLEIDTLNITGSGPYNIDIMLEPVPHARGGRVSNEEAEASRTVLASLKGASLEGSNSGSQNSFEVNVYAPNNVEDFSGDPVILACFEFHSVQLDFARNARIDMVGFLSGAYAHSQEVYDSLEGLTTQEEFEAVPALTNAVGHVKYIAPRHDPADPFMGWKAEISIRPVKK